MADAIRVLTNEQIEDMASKMAKDFLARIAIVTGQNVVDARIVMIACGSVAGSYAWGISDEAIKRDLLERFTSNFWLHGGLRQ